ncbi:MAG: YbaB/EbfC family nucleoid-associated protein [Anaerolineales bacterium]|nr:YbaB/EbfC family nucleoid-associated protein [Anaerolineales bacterium]
MAKSKGKGKGFSLGGLGGGGGVGMPPGGAKAGLAGQLQAMQKQMLEAQESLGEKTVEVTAGGGAIRVVMTGHQKLQSITIDPEVVTPEDVEMLQDLIVAAVNEAVEASQNLAADQLGSITGGLNIPGLF